MSEYAECPSCGQSKAKKVSFTWWGGMIGPGILNHVKCQACGTSYNGKTGNSNTVGIITPHPTGATPVKPAIMSLFNAGE